MKKTSRFGDDTDSTRREPPAVIWPKVVPAPAVWEAGAMANRRGKGQGSLYRPRKMGTLRRRKPVW